MDNPSELDDLSVEQLVEMIREKTGAGVNLSFPGKANILSVGRRVRPRVQRTRPTYSVGDEKYRDENLILEGDNLQGMASLYREHGRIDLIVADPPYNTGSDFRYNDKWDTNPNDDGLGDPVGVDDPAKHTKWMKFMYPRLQVMMSMLKPTGVLAICIDYRELFHLGQMCDEIFGEKNRIAIINWEKTTAPRSDSGHVTSATEYVLVYAKNESIAQTQRLDRKESSNKRYGNPDRDPGGPWRENNLSARTYSRTNDYAIQSPFTGELHVPPGNRAWAHPKRNVKAWLAEWGTEYVERDIGDGRSKALMVKGGTDEAVPKAVSERARKTLKDQTWPFIWFGMDGQGRPRTKTYLEKVRKGSVPTTYWADDDALPLEIGSTSWDHEESGRSSDGLSELNDIIGQGHGFETVKPLKLIQKIIQIWCPPNGLVLDPFAGSGTTAHAVMSLNLAQDAKRSFIMIEEGSPQNKDSYAKSLTAERLKRVVTGNWAKDDKGYPVPGGFTFKSLTKRVDAETLLLMERDEMIDAVVASHSEGRKVRSVRHIDDKDVYKYLIAQNSDDEGIYLVWNGPDSNTDLTEEVYEECVEEGEKAQLVPRYHVYSRLNLFVTDDVRWYQIPDRILQDFGLDLKHESFSESEN
ncbi:DNA methylase N-4/N-6 domain protein [Gordonia terrae C-6]|uniref:DNA methylase N-4/N-6 domain protein n=1 Tax=Gordonia terrae C-6 TaxID=1316928 RepID=R7YCR0_9ACTN|nr:site-specific DNA-methyltransferase [Gordonia terrae]EON33762.1 DNA methylase N-4/N-6 domain protein [Gordonia terrae C-6]